MVQYVKRQTSAQMVAKQHLKLHLRRIRNREYSRLRDMVPSIAKKDKISKVNYDNDFWGVHFPHKENFGFFYLNRQYAL